MFDGPLFDLPGGTVKAAVGATYTTFIYQTTSHRQHQRHQPDRALSAGRGTASGLGGVHPAQRADLQRPERHSASAARWSWNSPGVTTSTATWEAPAIRRWRSTGRRSTISLIRGTWGNSFRAPAFGELSPLANVAIAGQNFSTRFAAQATTIDAGCAVRPAAGGLGRLETDELFGPGATARRAARQPVRPGRSYCPAAISSPMCSISGGISMNGGAGAAAPIRAGGGWDGSWSGLTPELATNWGIGFDYTPTGNFLTGLNLQATYYIIKLNGVLRGFGNPTADSFNDRDARLRLPGAHRLLPTTPTCRAPRPAPATCFRPPACRSRRR